MSIDKKKNGPALLLDSERNFRNLIDSVKSGVYMADMWGNLVYVNQSFVDILGYETKEEVLGLNLAQQLYAHPWERDEFLKKMCKTGFVKDYEVKNVRKDGSVVILSATSNFIRNDKDVVIGVQGVVTDITEKKNWEMKLLKEKSKTEQILTFDERINGIHELDQLINNIVEKVSEILDSQRCSVMLLDEATKELCIKGAKGIIEETILKSRIKLGSGIAGYVAEQGQPVMVKNIEYDHQFQRPNRPGYEGRSFICVAIKLEQTVIGVINVADKNSKDSFDDLDLKILTTLARQSAIAIENAKMVKELEYLCHADPLTNAGNYRCLIKTLDQEISRVKRFGGALSLLIVDIDNFKLYNDVFGHLEGDRVLKELAKVFKKNLRSIDAVCRYGGDEFMVILPGSNASQAQIVAQKTQRQAEALPLKKKISLSIGIAQYKETHDRLTFIAKADMALYEAKRTGKHKVCVSCKGGDHDCRNQKTGN